MKTPNDKTMNSRRSTMQNMSSCVADPNTIDDLPNCASHNRFLIFLRNCYIAATIVVLLIITIIPPILDFTCKNLISIYNPIFVAISLVVLMGSAVLLAKRDNMSAKSKHGFYKENRKHGIEGDAQARTFRHFVLVGMVVLFILQVIVLIGGRFVTGWDVWYLTSPDDPMFLHYFSRYPNQLFLHGIFLGVANFLSLFVETSYYKVFVCIGMGCVYLCVPLTAYIAKKLVNERVGCITFVLMALICGVSPWILVPYSDTIGMLFTVLVLWAYVCLASPENRRDDAIHKQHTKNELIRWFIIGFAAYIGYSIKPTTIFVLVAIVVIEVVLLLSKIRRIRKEADSSRPLVQKQIIGNCARSIATCIVAIVLAFGCVEIVKSTTYAVDENAAYSATHYLMLGVNQETGGVYSASDEEFSDSFASTTERQDANLSVYVSRLTSFSPGQLMEFLVRKACTNFADGTFAWGAEGNFYYEINGHNPIVLGYYGIGARSQPLVPFDFVAQLLWITVVTASILLALSNRPSYAEVVIAFSLLMLGVFLMVFEARARYLILYLPYAIILASIGWDRLRARLEKRDVLLNRKEIQCMR